MYQFISNIFTNKMFTYLKKNNWKIPRIDTQTKSTFTCFEQQKKSKTIALSKLAMALYRTEEPKLKLKQEPIGKTNFFSNIPWRRSLHPKCSNDVPFSKTSDIHSDTAWEPAPTPRPTFAVSLLHNEFVPFRLRYTGGASKILICCTLVFRLFWRYFTRILFKYFPGTNFLLYGSILTTIIMR